MWSVECYPFESRELNDDLCVMSTPDDGAVSTVGTVLDLADSATADLIDLAGLVEGSPGVKPHESRSCVSWLGGTSA